MLESLAAEFAPVDKSTMAAHVGKFRARLGTRQAPHPGETLGGHRSRLIF